MKGEILQRLGAVLKALNGISVSGKQNLVNLSGSIAIIEEVTGMLVNADVVASSKEKS